jgi:hypothetical protein
MDKLGYLGSNYPYRNVCQIVEYGYLHGFREGKSHEQSAVSIGFLMFPSSGRPFPMKIYCILTYTIRGNLSGIIEGWKAGTPDRFSDRAKLAIYCGRRDAMKFCRKSNTRLRACVGEQK